MQPLVGIEIMNFNCRLGFSYTKYMNQAESLNVRIHVKTCSIYARSKVSVLISLLLNSVTLVVFRSVFYQFLVRLLALSRLCVNRGHH